MNKKYKSINNKMLEGNGKLTDKELEKLIEKSTINVTEYQTKSRKDDKGKSYEKEKKQ